MPPLANPMTIIPHKTEKGKRKERIIIYQRKTNNPRIGRPKASNPKNIEFGVSIDIVTEMALRDYCEKNGISKSEAVRRAIHALLKLPKAE